MSDADRLDLIERRQNASVTKMASSVGLETLTKVQLQDLINAVKMYNECEEDEEEFDE